MVEVVEKYKCSFCGYEWDDRNSAVACEGMGTAKSRFNVGDRVWITAFLTVSEGVVTEIDTTHGVVTARDSRTTPTEARLGLKHVPYYTIEVKGLARSLRYEEQVYATEKEARASIGMLQRRLLNEARPARTMVVRGPPFILTA
jgi:hypothetical protein